MNGVSASLIAARWRGLVACCLLVALPLYGVSATLTALLGALHFHTAPVQATPVLASAVQMAGGSMQGWQDFRRMTDRVGPMAPPHVHGFLGRHVHAAGDASVTVVGADGGTGGSDGSAPSAGVPFDAVPSAALALPAVINEPLRVSWRPSRAALFLSTTPLPLDRPPNADHA